LALAYSGTEVVPLNLAASKSYWEMTKVMIESLNKSPEFNIPMDWSSASYPLAFGALKQNIYFPGLQDDPYQADAKFLSILKQINVIQETPEGIRVKPCTIKKDFKLEVSDCLDLVPALSFFLSHIEGTHFLTGIKNLVYKESDRLQEIIKLLEEFGLKASTDGSVLQIEGSRSLRGVAVDLQLPDDHRMVMTGALFLRYHQGGSITPASAVDKSYPDFFSLLSV
jgi:3-phosphoshikimate 1-carboxyvinyltransferase